MAEYQTYDNSGSLFPIKGEKKSERHPDFNGEITVNGKTYWLSGWRKTSDKGTRWMSLSVTVKDPSKTRQKPASQAPAPRGPTFEELDDDIPF